MSFFEPPPPPPEPPAQRPRPEWMGPPGNELGVGVPIRYVIVRTEGIAILLDGFVAYSNGAELEVTVRLRVELRRDAHSFHRLNDDVRLGFRFADGRKATSVGTRPWTDPDDPGPVLLHRGGSGDDRELRQRYWLWPLPPPGPLQAVVELPTEGVAETEIEVDGDAIRAAAARVDVLWRKGVEPGGRGWTRYTSSASEPGGEPGKRDG